LFRAASRRLSETVHRGFPVDFWRWNPALNADRVDRQPV
jgi:hypothetical protein